MYPGRYPSLGPWADRTEYHTKQYQLTECGGSAKARHPRFATSGGGAGLQIDFETISDALAPITLCAISFSRQVPTWWLTYYSIGAEYVTDNHVS